MFLLPRPYSRRARELSGADRCSSRMRISEPPAKSEHPASPMTSDQPTQLVVETATEARQAIKVGTMRYVLGFGLVGAAVGLMAAWFVLGS